MSGAYNAVEAAMKDVDTLRRHLKKNHTSQVRSQEELSLIKAVCFTWFKNHRTLVALCVEDDLLTEVDDFFKFMLSATGRATSRAIYYRELKAVKEKLSGLREYTVTLVETEIQPTVDTPPSFLKLVSDPKMQAILERRWNECGKCVSVDAPLAAIVMMGGLLEALLLSRVHKEKDKSHIFKAVTAPKEKTTGKPEPLQKWGLRHYIDVAHELGWISASAKDVGEVLRDYRNYVHPYKELSHAVILNDNDTQLLWEIAKSIARQLLS